MGPARGTPGKSWCLPSPEPAPAAEAPGKVQKVGDFVPEDSLDRSFLEDTAPPKDEKKVAAKVLQDSDRLGRGHLWNPHHHPQG